jgi:hypothetical protein
MEHWGQLLLFIISIQPLGQFGQETEPSQVTGMALVRCILGKFLGVVCHCFPPLGTILSKTCTEKQQQVYVFYAVQSV